MRKFLLFIFSIFIISISTIAQNTDRKDRIIASYLYSFGVMPAQGEIDYWINDPLSLKNVSDLINEHKKNIRNNQSLSDRAIRNSYLDALGREPRADEYNAWRPSKLTYSDLIDNHVRYLREYPSEFTRVIRLSYQTVFNRQPNAQEIRNWKSWGARSFLSMVQEHQKNLRSGMFAVTPSSSQKLRTDPKSGLQYTPSSVVMGELKNHFNASGVISTGGGNVISTGGGNVISTGGGNVISTGGGN